MSEHNVRLDELLHYLREGRILDAMTEFYAENVITEKPACGSTKGLPANIEREKQFVQSVRDFRNFLVPHSATSPNTAIYETIMDWVDTQGKDHHVEQVSVQTWKNGKIVHERFYYSA